MTDPQDAGARLEELLARRELDAGDATAEDRPPEPEDAPGPHQSAQSGDAGETGPETADDNLPDAPLFALLKTVQRDVGVDRIDRMWIFPPRRFEDGETAVVVVAAYAELDDDRRRVYAAHYTAPAQGAAPSLALQEFGTAPAERVGRVVEDVVERLKDEPAAAPQAVHLEGNDDRWHETLHALAERHLEEAAGHPRLRRSPRPGRP